MEPFSIPSAISRAILLLEEPVASVRVRLSKLTILPEACTSLQIYSRKADPAALEVASDPKIILSPAHRTRTSLPSWIATLDIMSRVTSMEVSRYVLSDDLLRWYCRSFFWPSAVSQTVRTISSLPEFSSQGSARRCKMPCFTFHCLKRRPDVQSHFEIKPPRVETKI